MPEGPEVKIQSEWLNTILAGAQLLNISTSTRPVPTIEQIDKKCKSEKVSIDWVRCRGKVMYWCLYTQASNGQKFIRYIYNHLGLVGHWRTTEAKYTAVTISFIPIVNGELAATHELYFDDKLKNGKFIPMTKDKMRSKLDKLGPDVTKQFTFDKWSEALASRARSRASIAATLIDQSFVCGIGNYLRSDILYKANIDPRTPTKDIASNIQMSSTLYSAIAEIIGSALLAGGTKIKTDLGVHYYLPTLHGWDINEFCTWGKYIPIAYKNPNLQAIKINGRYVYTEYEHLSK